MIDTNAHYQGGSYWETNRSQTSGCPIYAPIAFPIDLVFKIEFCNDVATAAKRHTWGALKLLYR